MPLFEHRDGLFHPTPYTRGPWDDRYQHGGPPLALLTGALERFGDPQRFALTRVNADFLAGIPIVPLRVEVEPLHLGRSLQRLRASLYAGDREVMRATGQRTRRKPGPTSPAPSSWPAPETLEPWRFPFFRNPVAYDKAVEMRVAGGRWGTTPIQMWARMTRPLVAGRKTSAREAAAAVADAQSGFGVPVDPERWSFVNPQVTIAFAREPVGSWVGLDIRSMAGGDGAGLAQSLLRDEQGWFGGASQTLILDARG